MTKRRLSILLILAVTLILSVSTVTAYAADGVMEAYNAISKAFAKFTPGNDTTEQDVLDYAKKALPSDSTVTLEIRDFKNTPAHEPEAGGNTTYGMVEAKIIMTKGTDLMVLEVRKLIPKEKTSDEKKLTEDWEAMSHAMHQVEISNKTTKEELLKAALSAAKYGTTAKWTKFTKVDATYEKKGDITGYMTMTLSGKSKELRFHEEIPMLERKLPSKKQCEVTKTDWEILRLVNIERFKEGRSLLTMVPTLQGVTCIRAEELNKKPSLKHTRPDGTSFRTAVPDSFENAGLGENIFACTSSKYLTAVAAMNGWMNSKGHRANILNKDYDYIGITSFKTQSVQIFAISKNKITSYTTSTGKKTFNSVEEMESEYLICKDSSGLKSYMPLDTAYMTKVKNGYKLKLNSKKTIKLTIKDSSTDSSAKSQFTDVESGDTEAVEWVTKQKIMTGINSKEFSPKASCTRGDVLTYLYKANGSPTPQSKNWFSDVKSTDTFYKPALWAQEKGLVDWGMLNPNDACLKGYALYYVWMSVGAPEPTKETTFTDFNDWVFYAKAVAWAEEKGIIKNTGDNKFNGDSAVCTRADIAKFLYGAYK